jgi:Peptidase inhibitor family I36
MRAFVLKLMKIGPLALLAVLAIGLAPASANPATDSTTLAAFTCKAGQVCLYKDTNFTGKARGFIHSVPDYRKVLWDNRFPFDNMDNDASSVINKTRVWVRLYQDVGYRGRVICMGPGSSVHRLGVFEWVDFPFHRTMDNRLSAHSTTRRDACDFTVKPGEHK